MFSSALRKKRALGLVLLAVLMPLFLTFNRAPKLDTIRGDIDDTAAVVANETRDFGADAELTSAAVGRAGAGLTLLCFQGYCARGAADESFLAGWWDFSLTYLKGVTIGMIFAFLVAGLAEVFFFPKGEAAGLGARRGLAGSVSGLAMGTPMTLCSACIVPVANSIRRQGGGAESVVAMVQGSSTLNLPALIMLFAIFTPAMAGTRIGVSVVGALALGPLVAWAAGTRVTASTPVRVAPTPGAAEGGWLVQIRDGARAWPAAALGYFVRLGPIMVIAALLSALVIQVVDEDIVSTVLGNNLLGVLAAASFGLLINVPLLFEIPLVAVLLTLGMGTAPAAVLLFTAAASGPITLWGLNKVLSMRGVVTLGAGTWALGVLAGLSVLAVTLVASDQDFDVNAAALTRTPDAGAAEGTGSHG